MRGIDISAGSGRVDFEKLKKQGYEFVIARAGFGSSVSQTDLNFHNYVNEALAVGLHVGAYWFIYARTMDEAAENGRCFLEVVDRHTGRLDMPLYIDYEYDSTRYYEQENGVKETKSVATEYIKRVAEVVERAGYYTGVYLNPDYIRNHVILDDLRKYTLWLAQWGVEKPTYDCGIWQRSGDTKIPEASGGVDLNECYSDFPTVIRRLGLNGFAPDAAPQASGTVKSAGDRWEILDDGNGVTIKLSGRI